MEVSPFNKRSAPGHPVKYLFHRSTFEVGPQYRNISDWQFGKTKPFYRKNLLAHFGCVNAIEFSKNGNLLVSGGDDRRVLLWKVDKALVSKDEPKVMQAEHLSNVFSLDFSCSSEKVISAGNDDQVILHDLTTGVPLDYFVHEQPVYGVSADPVNENIFCSACDDGRILIYDIRESGNDPFCLTKVSSPFHSVMFHPIEPRLVVTSNSKEGVATWDVRMPKRVFLKYGTQNSSQCCMSARFNKMGTQILALRRRLPPILYSTDSANHLYQFNHRGYYNSCTMKSCSFAGQDDQYVMSGSDNFDLHVWKIPQPGSDQWVNKADMVLRGHRSIVNQVRYNYVYNIIASSGVEKIVKLWSPYPTSEERGGKSPAVITNESKRRIYTPDDYVSLVMQAGQGHFMSLTFEGCRKTTKEDSRMLAFFDALVQRDINGISDEESDAFYETSYTNTVYTSPETSSSENEDEDSNPPSFRSLLSAESESNISNTFRNRITGNNLPGEGNERVETTMQQTSESEDPSVSNSTARQSSIEEPNERSLVTMQSKADTKTESTSGKVSCDTERNQQTESDDKDASNNMITQLILEKEDIRRKNTSKSNATIFTHSENESENSDRERPSSSSVRPLKVSHGVKKRKTKKKRSSKSTRKKHSKFRKQLLEMRRRERLETPVYDSSRNAPQSSSSSQTLETSYSRISELMTRNQTNVLSDSTLESSSSSSSESSSSDKEYNGAESQPSRKRKKPTRSKRLVIESDSSSSSSSSTSGKTSANNNGSDVDVSAHINERQSVTDSRNCNSQKRNKKDLKRKWRPPCKLNEACKAYFKNCNLNSESPLEFQMENPESDIPRKRVNLQKLEDSSDDNNTSVDSSKLVEQVVFKRLGKYRERNYRKNTPGSVSTSGTPPDSGIDVSKEPKPCCSKSVKVTSVSTTGKASKYKSSCSDRKQNQDDPGFGQIDTSDSSEEETY